MLTHLPADPDRVASFLGLGNLNVPADHGGFFTPREGWYQAPTIPVHAPADGRIVSISRDWYDWLAPHGNDLALTIRVSTTMTVTYAHMSDFSQEIWTAAGDLPSGYGEWKDVDIPVTSGQVVGYVGTQGSLDWHITDTELDLHFENPARYPADWRFAGCYHDYYGEPLRSRLYAITIRTAEPRCGRIDYDVAGRIAGNWFLEGETPAYAFNDYSTHLAIVYDEVYGERIAIADGIAIRPSSPHAGDESYNVARVFWVEGNAPAPESVGVAEGLVKYAIMDRQLPSFVPDAVPALQTEPPVVGVFLVQMLDPGRIRVERVMGKTPDEVAGFGPNARTYVR